MNTWQIVAAVLAELAAAKNMHPGDDMDLPPIHIKSGTTTVDIQIHVKQDPPKKHA